MSQLEARASSTEPTASATASTATLSEVTLTLADIEAGLSALPRAKIARWIAVAGAVGIVAMVAYRWMEGRDRTSLVVIAVVLLGLLVTSRNPAARVAKRVYASLPEDAKRIQVGVDELGFRVISSGNESLLAWSDVYRCVEARSVMVVFVSRDDAQILPKRAFGDADVAAIRQWSKTKIVRRDEPWLTPQLRTRMMIWLTVFAVVWIAYTYLGNR